MSTNWTKKESQERMEKFMKGYDSLVKQYEVELMSFPQFIPSGKTGFTIGASMMPIDKKNQSVPSPLQGDNGSIL